MLEAGFISRSLVATTNNLQLQLLFIFLRKSRKNSDVSFQQLDNVVVVFSSQQSGVVRSYVKDTFESSQDLARGQFQSTIFLRGRPEHDSVPASLL